MMITVRTMCCTYTIVEDDEWQAYAWAEYNGDPLPHDEPADCYEVVNGGGEVVARYCL